MRIRRQFFPAGLALIAGVLGCGGDVNEGDRSSGKDPEPPPPEPVVIIDIAVDANRDGKVDPADPADQDRENEWNAQTGASFLANLDDDDADKERDADDDIMNDPDDLATIVVSPWAEAPEEAVGVFTIDALSAENVRIWKRSPDGASWALVAGSVGPCTDAATACQYITQANLTRDEVLAGVTLGIEGRRFRLDITDTTWTGMVDLSYSVLGKDAVPVTSKELPDGIDRAKMRVAPWMLFGNLSAFDTAYADSYDTTFTSHLAVPLEKAGLKFKKISNYADQWVQDYFQTAWTSIPGPDGTVKGMRVANGRPWSQPGASRPYSWLKKSYLGPDRGIIETYKEWDTGDSFDSHGNHDLLPPYKNGDESFPHGRIILGSGVLKETRAFYGAQEVQAPVLRVDSSWLYVGHVDEVLSYVPAKTPRGWKLLVGSPKLARAMLEKAAADGFGATQMFVGKQWDAWAGGGDAAISIDDVLADQDLMASSQAAQAEIDGVVATVRDAVGLAEDEIVEIPFLFEEEEGQGLVAYNPGTVNLLAFSDYIVQADPFGPQINGEDLFKRDLVDRLGSPVNQLGKAGQGLFVYFADDWDLYHVLLGEVHCGTNVEAPPPASEKWWESGR
jgi:protein-arginine deiminase